jgi:HAD superfamily hydrolase (TIGR01549 family)
MKAVVFDAYGTLVRIGRKSNPNPFKMVSGNKRIEGVNPLISPISLEEYDRAFHHDPDYTNKLTEAAAALTKELKAIKPFPESVDVLKTLKRAGYKTCVCSNLAQPYAQPVIDAFGELVDEYVWSFEAGFAKPQEGIYKAVEERLGLSGKDIHMIGDTYDCDYTGPIKFGWSATFLDRKGKSKYYSVSRLNSLFLEVKV